MPDRPDVLAASDLRKSYGGLVVLDAVSLELPAGGRLGVIGPNGSGKTTLMNVLSGFVAADTGRVRVLGQDVSRASASRRAQAGIARTFQIAAVINEWTVYENVAFAAATQQRLGSAALRPLLRNSAIRRKVLASAERWGIADELDTPVAELSYGIVRRTELAVATMGDPRVLLLDEPAAGLSETDGAEVVKIAETLYPDAAIVLVEHDMEIMFSFCQELLVLDGGRPIAHGEPAVVREDPRVREAYLGSTL